MASLTWLYLIPIIVVCVLGIWVVGTVRRGRGPVHCPNCVTPTSARRRPLFRLPMQLGGWMCPHCGTLMDNWGRNVSGTASAEYREGC
jgi:hypothetical protein